MGWKEAFVRPTVRTSLIQLARAFEEEGGKKGGGRGEGKSRQRRSLELTSHNEGERELGKLDAAAHHSCHALLAGLGGESERL